MKRSILCFRYPTWEQAHTAHKNDYCVYTFDVLPINYLCVVNLRAYIGSAGANAQRNQECKTASKSAGYIRSSLDARYRGGSYTKNHTCPQSLDIFCISRNIQPKTSTLKQWRDACNANGYKSNERLFLGYLEYRLHLVATKLSVPLNNREIPKHASFPEYDTMSDDDFFNMISFEGDIPPIVLVAQNKITIEQYQQEQKQFAVDFVQQIVDSIR